MGITTIELLSGKVPFAGLPQMSVMYKIAKEGALPEMPPSTSGTEIHKHTHTHTHTQTNTRIYMYIYIRHGDSAKVRA